MSSKSPSPSSMTLQADNVCVSFGGVQALNNTSLRVVPGKITGIIGPNGAGKSTLLDVLSGATRPDSGSISLGSLDITRHALFRRARLGVVRTFQIARELSSLTVMENLLLASPAHPGDQLWRSFAGSGAVRRAEVQAQDKASQLLNRVRLGNLANQPAGALSGGQKKLLELARALMQEPAIVLLDEPAAGVSPALIEELCEFIVQLKTQGITFAIVEHNMDVVASLCDHLYVMAQGAVLTEGNFAEVTSDPRVVHAYLGS